MQQLQLNLGGELFNVYFLSCLKYIMPCKYGNTKNDKGLIRFIKELTKRINKEN